MRTEAQNAWCIAPKMNLNQVLCASQWGMMAVFIASFHSFRSVTCHALVRRSRPAARRGHATLSAERRTFAGLGVWAVATGAALPHAHALALTGVVAAKLAIPAAGNDGGIQVVMG